MKTFLFPLAMLAIVAVPVGAEAGTPCRNAKGQFAKCGAPGAMTLAQYNAMKAMKGKAPMPMKPMPMKKGAMPMTMPSAPATAKPGMMAKMKTMMKPKAQPSPVASPAPKHS